MLVEKKVEVCVLCVRAVFLRRMSGARLGQQTKGVQPKAGEKVEQHSTVARVRGANSVCAGV